MPQRRTKSQKAEKANAAQKEKILSSREKILKIKRALLAIVEGMLEPEVSEEWFLEKCTKLCHADYNDVIQERSIENICGYPLCSNTIKQVLKQKYHISRVNNKVYDLTERKCFCSNHCYKASNYLKAQLSPIPLYMRKEETIKVHLLSANNNRGSAGEEIVFHHTIPKEEIDKVYTEEQSSNHYTKILNEEIKKCTDSLSSLKIKEHLFEQKYVFGDQPEKKNVEGAQCSEENESDSSSKLDSDDSEDEKLFPHYDNMEVLIDKHMPIPKCVKKSVLISPRPPTTSTNSPVSQLSLNFVSSVFKDWITEDTIKYLMGEKHVYGIKAEHLFETMTSDAVDSEKLAAIKNEYINLCIKIDNLPDTDVSDSSGLEDSVLEETKKKSHVKNNIDQYPSKRTFKRRPKRRPSNKSSEDKNISLVENKSSTEHVPVSEPTETKEGKAKSVTSTPKVCETADVKEEKAKSKSVISAPEVSESTDTKEEKAISKSVTSAPEVSEPVDTNVEKSKARSKSVTFAPEVLVRNITHANSEREPVEVSEVLGSTVREPMFPLVDSLSQNALRRQVLHSKLKAVYVDVLPIIGLHYTDIRHGVKQFIDTLSLTPTNVMFKPKEWKLIALILLRILTRTILKDIHDEVKFLKLCEDNIMPIRMTITEIENLVNDIISPENIVTLKR